MLKPWQRVCLDCPAVILRGSNGRRKRCPSCQEAYHKRRMLEWVKLNYGGDNGTKIAEVILDQL